MVWGARGPVEVWVLGLLLQTAWGASCPEGVLPLREQLDAAWAQYNDAEVQAAEALVQVATEQLPCQTQVVPTADLLDLYRLDALISITVNDNEGAVFATLRAVAVQHEGAVPDSSYGPYLIELYETWSLRLGGALVKVGVDGGGQVWVDGRPLQAPQVLGVAQGEHLIQVEAHGGVSSQLLDLRADHLIVTGAPGPTSAFVAAPAAPPAAAPAPLPEPVPMAPAPTPVPAVTAAPSSRRKRPLWAFAGAGLAGAGAAFALGSAWVSEKNFLADPYAGQGALRADNIARDARTIRTAYQAGYGLAAVSGGLLTFGVVGLPAAQGPTLGWRVRW